MCDSEQLVFGTVILIQIKVKKKKKKKDHPLQALWIGFESLIRQLDIKTIHHLLKNEACQNGNSLFQLKCNTQRTF